MNDNSERELITKELNKNIIVSASAGSGKTTMLVQRMVALVEDGVSVTNIAALTFTKKAANEFYERFYDLLDKRIKGIKLDHAYLNPNPSKEAIERDKIALENIDLCFLGTIDAFFNTVLMQYPLEAGIPINSELIEDFSLLKPLIVRHYDDSLLGAHGKEIQKLAYIFKDYYPRIDQDIFLKYLQNICFCNAEYKLECEDINSLEFKTLEDDYIKDANLFLQYLANDCDFIEFNEDLKTMSANNYIYNNLNSLKKENNLSDCHYHLKKIKEIALLDNDGFLPTFITDLLTQKGKKKIQFILDNNSKLKINEKRIFYSYIYTYIQKMFDIIKKDFKDKGILTFNTSMLYLSNLLRKDDKNNIDVISKISKKYQRFLIDEFQDTSPLQSEIFFRLTSEERNINWKELTPKPGSLFVVGDPKQGIYHFRGADITSFLDFKELFSNPSIGIKIDLVCNHRSNKELCEYFNEAFAKLLSETNEFQEQYPPIPLDEKKDNIGSDYNGAYTYNETIDEPNKVAGMIKEMVDQEKKINGRKISFDDFMIITSNKDNVKLYKQALDKLSIPSFAEGKISFDVDLLKGLIWLFEYILKKDAQIKVKLLTSSLFRVDVLNNQLVFDNLLNEVSVNVINLINKNVSISYIFENMLTIPHLLERLSKDGLDVLFGTINYLKESEENNDITSINEIINFLDHLLESSDVERISALSTNSPKVRVANLHKVKGLQAPIVFLVSGPSYSYHPNTHFIPDEDKMFIPFLYEYGGNKSNAPNIDKYSVYIDFEKIYSENVYIRLLYVAATRAEQALFISPTYKTKESYWKPLCFNNVENITFLNHEEQDLPLVSAESLLNVNNVAINRPESVNKATYRLIKPSNEENHHYYNKVDENSLFVDSFVPKEDSLVFGTLVHNMMEIIINNLNNEINGVKLCLYLVEKYNVSHLYSELSKVFEKINDGGYPQTNGLPDDILNLARSGQCHTEVPFSYVEDDDITSGYIDLIIELDNEFVIVDYKTDNNQEKYHKHQLDCYKKALSKKTNKKISAYIYNIIK